MNNQTKLIALSALVLSVSACSTHKITQAELDLYRDISNKPTISFSCPDSGCQIKEFAYTDPRDRAKLPKQTNGNDVAIELIRAGKSVINSSVPWVGVTALGIKGIEAAGDRITDSNNSPVTTTTNSSTAAPHIVTQDVIHTVEPVVIQVPTQVIDQPVLPSSGE